MFAPRYWPLGADPTTRFLALNNTATGANVLILTYSV